MKNHIPIASWPGLTRPSSLDHWRWRMDGRVKPVHDGIEVEANLKLRDLQQQWSPLHPPYPNRVMAAKAARWTHD